VLCFRCGSYNPDGSEFCSQCGQKFVEKKKSSPGTEVDPEIQVPSRDADPEEKAELKTGSQLADRYEIQDVLGSGPIGTVYRAHDLEIEVEVALKVIHPKLLQTRDERKRFLSEIRGARKINHPNVVRLYDEDQDGELVFFTMQLLEGLSLRKIVRLRSEKSQKFSVKELEPIFSHICQALDRAHETTVHGDLKPENIIVLPDMLKVTDFGLIDALPRTPFVAAQKTTTSGLAYLAPEMRDSEAKLTSAADIYSLGVMLCEMLTGVVYEGPTSKLPVLDEATEKWQPILVKALNESPDRRYSTSRDFFEEFHVLATGKPKKAVSVPPRPAPSRDAKKVEEEKPKKAKKRKPAIDDADEYPPTVVDAETIGAEDLHVIEDDDLEAAPQTEDELLEDIAGEAEPDDLEEPEDFLDPDDLETDEATMDELDEGETLVATPTPHPSAIAPDSELRVARPVDSEPPPSRDRTDVIPKQRVSKAPQKPAESAPPTAPPAVVVSSQTAPPGQQAAAQQAAAQQAAAQQAVGQQPQYGPFSQPPFPPSFVTQPPMPRPSRAPTYIFLAVLLMIVGVGVYFLVDYLRAQTELARAQADAARETKEVATVGPKKPDDGKPLIASSNPEIAKKTAEDLLKEEQARKDKEAEEAKKAEDAKKAEEAKKIEDAKKEEERIKEEARKAEEALAAELAKKKSGKPTTASKRLEAKARKKAAEAKRAENARKEAERKRKLAEKKRKENERKKQLEHERKLAAAKKIADAKKAAEAKKPKVEEVPDVGEPSPPPPKEPTPPPKEVAVVEKSGGKCPRGMVSIAAGKSYIGSATNDPMRNFGEIKLHTVTAKAFCIDRYEYPNAPGRKPTTSVSWKQANKLCKKRGKRLCTEEEWEYACKGKGNRRFPYGNKWNAETCNTEDASGEDGTIGNCGSYPRCRSPFGVFDLSGNVSEWTSSNYSPGAGARTYKGGSATRPNWATRCASRSSASPGTRKADLGFRCCAKPK
jgi:eukaryotic-like serine/threonine-protein kinase